MTIAKAPRLLIIPLVILIGYGCEESDSVTGSPPGESIDEKPVSVGEASFNVKTDFMESRETDELTRDMLGTYFDTTFGRFKAMIYTNFKLADDGFSETFINQPENVDSVILTLPFGGDEAYFGNKSTEQTIAFYELEERIFRENAYRSDADLDHNDTKFGEWNGTLDPAKGELRVKMNQDMLDKFRNATEENLNSSESFEGFFNGLFIRPEDDFNSQSGQGAIAYLELQEGAQLDFYHNDTMKDSVLVNAESARINTYDSDISNASADTGFSQDHAFVKPLGGLKATLTFDSLEKWVEDGLIAVHKAEVTLPASSFYHESHTPPDVLRMEATNSAGDVLTETEVDYQEEEQRYQFNIPLYFQDVFKSYAKGEQPDLGGLDISIPEDEPVLANPLLVPLGMNNGKTDSVKVEFTYSKVEEQ